MVDIDGGFAVLDLFHPQAGRVVIVLPDLLSILQDPGQAVLRVVFVLPGKAAFTFPDPVMVGVIGVGNIACGKQPVLLGVVGVIDAPAYCPVANLVIGVGGKLGAVILGNQAVEAVVGIGVVVPCPHVPL